MNILNADFLNDLSLFYQPLNLKL